MATPIVTGDRGSARVLFTQSSAEERRRLQLAVHAAAQIEALCGAVLRNLLDEALITACTVRAQELAGTVHAALVNGGEEVGAICERIEGLPLEEARHD